MHTKFFRETDALDAEEASRDSFFLFFDGNSWGTAKSHQDLVGETVFENFLRQHNAISNHRLVGHLHVITLTMSGARAVGTRTQNCDTLIFETIGQHQITGHYIGNRTEQISGQVG